tara:strand:- start:804 stop:2576 length:1773 start_codon:yes stop_codon:yes gene_type:complete
MALTKIKGAGINISATEKLYFDGGGNTYIHESAADVLDFYVGGANMLKLTESTTNTITITSDLTVGADDAGHDVIFYGNTASSNMTWDTSADDLILNDATLLIDQDDNTIALKIDSEATSTDVFEIDGSALTSGRALLVYSASDRDSGAPLVRFFDDNASNDGNVLEVRQDGDSNGIFIDHNGNGDAISIDFEGTSGNCIEIQAPTSTTGTCLLIQNANALTTGGIAEFHSNSSDTGTRDIVKIQNDHASATGTTGLRLVQDAAATALSIDHNANGIAIHIDSEATTQAALQIEADSLTQGAAAYFYSNCAESSSRKLVHIKNDNDGSTSTVALYVQQDANSFGAEIKATDSGFDTSVIRLDTERAGNAGFNFLDTVSGHGGGSSDTQHRLRGNGETLADGAYFSDGADYAEYFESKDGNAITVGVTVKLDGDKVVVCKDGDTPIGVVRPRSNSVVIGNSAPFKWTSKYLKDDYGAYIEEEYTVTEWVDGKNEDGSNNDIQYHTDKIPSDVTVPSDATVVSTEKDGTKLMRRKINPDYDESKTYKPREERDEWCLIGLLGQIPITKGQPMASNWIKMKDVSDTVEMWMVK